MISDWLPVHEFEERHATAISAPPEAVGQALREVSLDDLRIVRGLWTLRELPARISGRAPRAGENGSFLDRMVALGGVILEERPGLVVAGLAGQFWRIRGGGLERFSTPAEFTAYVPEDACKAVVDFEWSDGTLVTTTRVHVPDAAARRRFALYWLVVRPFSGLIRILVLRAVKRRAEAYDRAG